VELLHLSTVLDVVFFSNNLNHSELSCSQRRNSERIRPILGLCYFRAHFKTWFDPTEDAFAGFAVLPVVTMKCSVFWDLTCLVQ
jgi:hypothetical protein